MKKEESSIINFPLLNDSYNSKKNQDLLDDFFNIINDKIINKEKSIILDIKNLISINSYILARILYFQKKAFKYGGRIKLININDNIKKILINLKFNDLFDLN